MKRVAGMLLPPLLAVGCGGSSVRIANSTLTSVVIQGASRQVLADMLTRAMLNRGYQVRSVDAEHAAFARPADAEYAAALLGAARAGAPEMRVRYALSDAKPGVQIVATIEMVTNPGSRFEHVSPPNGGDDQTRVQEALNVVRDRVAKLPPPVPPSLKSEPMKKAVGSPEPKRTAANREPDEPPPERPAKMDTRPPPEDDMIERMKKAAMGKP